MDFSFTMNRKTFYGDIERYLNNVYAFQEIMRNSFLGWNSVDFMNNNPKVEKNLNKEFILIINL